MCVVDWKLVLGFTKAFLSWPVVVLVLGLIFIFTFKAQISSFLSRITEGDVYGMKFKASSSQDQSGDSEIEPPSPPDNDVKKWVVENPDKAIEEYQRVFNSYKWERAMNLIYGTQVDMLEFLSKKGDEGVMYIDLAFFHAEHQRRMQSTSYQMPDYMNFLQQHGFIDVEGADHDLKIKVTPYGLSFLSYIKATYPDTWNKKPF